MTRLPTRDIIATSAVAAAVILYLLWLADAAPPGMSGARVTGLAVLGLGFIASATAVVPVFDQLMRGNRVYLASTSLLGLVALVAGVVTLWSASQTALAVLMVALVTLWVTSTTHHVLLARPARSAAASGSRPAAPVDRTQARRA